MLIFQPQKKVIKCASKRICHVTSNSYTARLMLVIHHFHMPFFMDVGIFRSIQAVIFLIQGFFTQILNVKKQTKCKFLLHCLQGRIKPRCRLVDRSTTLMGILSQRGSFTRMVRRRKLLFKLIRKSSNHQESYLKPTVRSILHVILNFLLHIALNQR